MSNQAVLELSCVEVVKDPSSRPVLIGGRILAIQHDDCFRKHGPGCDVILGAGAVSLSPRIFSFPSCGGEDAMFSFTDSIVMLAATTLLHTVYGRLKCLPDAEYKLWLNASYCQVAPLAIILDDVTWRVIASENAVADDDDIKLADDMNPVFFTYLHAHKEGGKLLQQVQTAVARGDKDLKEHRDFLFKLFSIVRIPPTLSHDLSKTALVNFSLGRCFHADDLDILKDMLTFEESMALCRRLHLEVENHHPEHGSRPALVVRDMYLDRVSRGIQKSHGWRKEAWHIPERYAPPEYKEDFSRLEQRYSCLHLEDPGELDLPEEIPGARIAVVWEDFSLQA